MPSSYHWAQVSGRSQTSGFVIAITVSTKGYMWTTGKDTHRPQRQIFPRRGKPLNLRKSRADTIFDKQFGCVCVEPYDTPGVDPEFICHWLNVDPQCLPKKQKPHRPSDAQVEVAKEEVDKLKEARAIKEVYYPGWLDNTVIVRKKNGKWRVCIDFTDLNKACLKDPFLVPKINQLIDATFGHLRMSFLDAFQGYHQIALAPNGQENTSFISLTGNFHCKVMPFGLKNAWSTYQRMVTKMFKKQLGRNMEAYIDDMVVRSKVVEDHLSDLLETFKTLRKHRLKLNASKCAFRVSLGKFLGYLVTHRGIEVNPNQIVALQNLKSPYGCKRFFGVAT